MKDKDFEALLKQVKDQIDNFDFKSALKVGYDKPYMQVELEKKIKTKLWDEMSPEIYLIFWFSLPE